MASEALAMAAAGANRGILTGYGGPTINLVEDVLKNARDPPWNTRSLMAHKLSST